MQDLTRRNFIAAGAALAAPMILRAQSKSGNAKPIMGEGEYKFEVEHDWALANIPSTIKMGNTHSVVQDKNGHIYVHHTVHATSKSPDAVLEFDDKGKFVRSWGAMFRGGAHGMHYSVEGRNEFLYFSDEKHGIVTKRTLKGEEVWTMGYPQWAPVYTKGPGAPGLNYRPTNIAINPANLDFWIGDGYGSFYMFHYSQKNGYPEFIRTFGGPVPAPAGGADQGKGKGGGAGAGKGAPPPAGVAPLDQAKAGPAPGGDQAKGKGKGGPPPPPPPLTSTNNPHGNWIDTRDAANPTLLIADRGNRRVLRYSLDDQPIESIDIGANQPCHFDQYKDLIVIPHLNSQIAIMQGNKVVATFGGPKADGPKNPPRTTENRGDFVAGQFVNPHGACFDKAGNIFVAEWVEIGRVTKLRRV